MPWRMLLASLTEGHLVDLFERRDAFPHLGESRVAQEGHALIPRGALNLRSRPPANDHFADAVGKVQQFRYGAASTETRARALQAAGAFGKLHPGPQIRI